MYQIRVDFVVDKTEHENDPIFRKIQELCNSLKIDVQIRNYDPKRYYEDCEFITRLPAIQIYEKGAHTRTLFPNEKPVYTIREIHEKCEMEYLNNLAKQQIWDEKLKYLKRIFFKKASLKTDLFNSRSML
uniref:Thioredoxin domain-containing protein n=1 Tax=viral metagenome TaxID=1070528 RepID=A0A6C0JNM1_9ZZZZ